MLTKSGTASFWIDLKARRLRVNKKDIIVDGKPVESHAEFGIDISGSSTDEILERIEELYQAYKNSVPGYNERMHYFKPLRYEDLSSEARIGGGNRIITQFQLEYFLLVCICSGLQWWRTDYFWRSEQDPSLVILKDWAW